MAEITVTEGAINLKISETKALLIEGITDAQKQAIASNTSKVSNLEQTTQTQNESISSLQGTVSGHTATITEHSTKIAELQKLSTGTVITAKKDYSIPDYNPQEELEEDKKMIEGIMYRIPFNKSNQFIPPKADDIEGTVSDRDVAYLKIVKVADGGTSVEVIIERYELKMNYDDIPTLDGQNNFTHAPTTDEDQDLSSLDENKLVKGSTVKTYVDAEINKVNQSAAKKVVYVESKPESLDSYEIGQIIAFPTSA